MKYITEDYVSSYIRPRPLTIHKGNAGRVCLIAGSYGMAGAAVLSAKGALKTGAGIVKVSVPDRLVDILQISVPEAMCIGEPEWEEFHAVAIGPGLGKSSEVYKLVEMTLTEFEGPVVIDADGINSFCMYAGDEYYTAGEAISDLIDGHIGPVVLTPHPGEANRLLEAFDLPGYDEMDRETCARLLAENTGAIVLLKGYETLVAGLDMAMNTTGNPGMATGGSGDVLTGILAALLAYMEAQDLADNPVYSPMEAVCAGAFIHGMAGDLAANLYGQWGITASDIIEFVPDAIKTLINN